MNKHCQTFLKTLLFINIVFFLAGCTAGSLFPTSHKTTDHRATAAIQHSAQTNLQGARKIALLLPTRGPHTEAAKTIHEGFLAAYYKNAKQDISAPTVKIYDTGEGKEVISAYHKAIEEGADFIVGPLTKAEVQTLSTVKLQVPVLALNTLPPHSVNAENRLYQFGLMPEDELSAIVEKSIREGHQHSLVLVPQNEWGRRMANLFASLWKNRGGQVLIRSLNKWEPLDNQLQTALNTAKNSDMVFLAASPELARQVKPLLTLYQPTLTVYATASVYSGHPDSKLDYDLEGIRFCDIPGLIQQPTEFPPSQSNPRYFALGMDAYLLATELYHTPSLPLMGLPGVTGILQLEEHRIHRKLIGARFEQGVPIPD